MSEKNYQVANSLVKDSILQRWLPKGLADLIFNKKNPNGSEVSLGHRKAYSLLFDAMRDHTLIYVRPAQGRVTYQSVLLDVNLKEQYLLIDELFPNIGFQMMPGDRFEVSIGDKRKALNFISELKMAGEYAGTPFYKMSLPDVVEEQQRRSNYRVELVDEIANHASWRWPNGQEGVATILDISMGGVKLKLAHDQAKIQQGSQLPGVTLTIGNDLQFKSNVDVKYVKNDANQEKTITAILGGQLTAIDPSDHLALQRYMHQLQRASLRRQQDEAGG